MDSRLFVIVFKDPTGTEKIQTALNNQDALTRAVDIAAGRTGDGKLRLVRIFSVSTTGAVSHYTLDLEDGQIGLLIVPGVG